MFTSFDDKALFFYFTVLKGLFEFLNFSIESQKETQKKPTRKYLLDLLPQMNVDFSMSILFCFTATDKDMQTVSRSEITVHCIQYALNFFKTSVFYGIHKIII